MCSVTEASAHLALKKTYQTICDSANAGYLAYIESPQATIHCARTAAGSVNDHIWSQLVNRMDGEAGVTPHFDNRRNLRFLKVDAKPSPILLWLKQVDAGRHHRIFPTSHACKVLDNGQSEMFPRAEILVLGFTINRDRTGILRVSINPPSRIAAPEWWIDLVPVASTKLFATTEHLAFEVKRSQQVKLQA